MKIDRLIAIITVLLQQDKITAPELAERFEVSRRTINRDIEDLCKAGIPIITAQGYGGGISMADGYKIEKSFFTEDELQAVFSALKGLDSVSKTSYLARLLDKFSSREHHIIVDDTIMIDLSAHDQIALTQKFETLKAAICRQQKVSFQYYYEKGEQRRTIEPYRLVFKWAAWYIFGYCLDRNAYRLFKLNRLWDLEVTEEHFAGRKIPGKELAFDDYFQSGGFRLKALFTPSEKHRLIEEYGIDCYTEMENGDLLFEWDFASYQNMRQWIFSFGDQVTIIGPQKLQDDRKRQAENILQRT